jgi:4-amino-4-deoxy-L-arabinose transferase-like glycosyltransferase
MKIKTKHWIIFLLLIGACLRFYNLNWGAPFYFHPDERNIANAVIQLEFPSQMNPHFFAYGSLPLYATYFTGIIINFFAHLLTPRSLGEMGSTVSFNQAIIIGRVYAAFFATLLIPLLYFLGKKLSGEKSGLLAAFFATTSTGFIQFAHFGTFEMWLTFFSTLLFWCCLKIYSSPKLLHVFFAGIVFGILVAVKVSSIALAPAVALALFLGENKKLKFILKSIFLFIFVSAIVYVATNPFAIIDFASFRGSMEYESGVVLGTPNVFYTQGFYATIPVLFQLQSIYPFLLNPLLALLFVPAFFYLFYKGLKTKNHSFLILNSFFLILFLSQAFLFAKWTRYMVPTLPFIYLIIALAITDVIARRNDEAIPKKNLQADRQGLPRSFQSLAMTVLILTSIAFSLSYFITAFVHPDTRVEAAKFAKQHIPSSSHILTEPYDLGNTAFPQFEVSQEYNFYDLDSQAASRLEPALSQTIETADYFISPSQRLLRSRTLNKKRFPLGNKFYSQLQTGEGDFKKIYQTPCDIFCKITYLGDPVFRFEETAMVFDRPTVMIFRKN